MKWLQLEKDQEIYQPGKITQTLVFRKYFACNFPPLVKTWCFCRRYRPLINYEHHSGNILMLDKERLAQKSGKVARQVKSNPHDELPRLLSDINIDQESMELLARFCHGYDISLSSENVVRVACLANFLEMTESYCPNNLLNKALWFFKENIVHSWNNSIKAIKSAESVLRQAEKLGLMECCVETIISEAVEDPRLLGEPLMTNEEDEESECENREKETLVRPSIRRKLFDMDWKKSEDLASLPLNLYAPIINRMSQRQVPPQYVAASLWQYAKNWIFSDDEVQLDKIDGQRETIEVLVRLIPNQTGLIPCASLCEMLRFAIAVEADAECRKALELWIGLQLDQAETKDLLMPCNGYTNQEKYDAECLKRILSHFYRNYNRDNIEPMRSVADLVDEFLAEIAADIDLKTATFVEIVDLWIAAAEGGNEQSHDGIYRAVDVFLEKHKHLTESEKEDLCGKVLDCSKLSGEALQHAALNRRLPLRVVVNALFASQLKLRDVIPKAVVGGEEEEEEEGEGAEVRVEMEKMGSKVRKLERECLMMKREIVRGGGGKREKKESVWREMKRKLGCMSMRPDSDCHVKKKKVHPR
ncbi:BTB/POZ domain-containing protein At5g17580-like isoform X1 [Salvia splendens]|uniref:BTB/POZ domain-containing protein At5g17580-like isoform X1 n=1 Tax=Salvia splendens TaxID=180675 RepID=UPI001C261E9E|nr:BTB/POZ domain-containing protein At5g17580-like isoform X1 [Salvia splendens]